MARSLHHTYVFHAMRTARAEGERAPCVRADCSVRGLSGSRGLGGLSTSSSRRCRSGVLVGEIGRGGGRRCGGPSGWRCGGRDGAFAAALMAEAVAIARSSPAERRSSTGRPPNVTVADRWRSSHRLEGPSSHRRALLLPPPVGLLGTLLLRMRMLRRAERWLSLDAPSLEALRDRGSAAELGALGSFSTTPDIGSALHSGQRRSCRACSRQSHLSMQCV